MLTFSRGGHMTDAVIGRQEIDKTNVVRIPSTSRFVQRMSLQEPATYATEAVERWAASTGRTAATIEGGREIVQQEIC